MRHPAERFPLTKENISSLERSYGSDHGREDVYRQEASYLDKYRIHERTRSERSGYLHSSRPKPDGEVSEKIVQDGLKPSRRQYERLADDSSAQRRDDLSWAKYDQDRREYPMKPAVRSGPLNSRGKMKMCCLL